MVRVCIFSRNLASAFFFSFSDLYSLYFRVSSSRFQERLNLELQEDISYKEAFSDSYLSDSVTNRLIFEFLMSCQNDGLTFKAAC